MEKNETRRSYDAYKILAIVAGAVVTAALAYKMREVFAAMTVAVVLFYILDPIATVCAGRRIGRLKVSRLAGVIVATIIAIAGTTVFMLILIPPIVDQVERFVKNLPEYTEKAEQAFVFLQQRYQRLELPPEVQESIRKSVDRGVSGSSVLLRHMADGMKGLFSQVVLIFMIPFLTFYMLLEKEDLKKSMVAVFPARLQEEAQKIISESSRALKGYIAGQLILSVIMGVGITVTLGLMGVKAPLLLGLVAGVTKLIPVIGIFLGCIPAAFVALSTSTSLAVWVIVIFTVIQLLENKVILPVLLSHYVNLSPLTILVALIVGEELGGVLGMFISTPIVAVLKVGYTHIRAKYV